MIQHLRAIAAVLMVMWSTGNPLATEAQIGSTPTPYGAYVFSAGAWIPLAATGSAGLAIPTPSAIGLYGWNGSAWVPCGTNACGSSGGGGNTGTGLNGATAPNNATILGTNSSGQLVDNTNNAGAPVFTNPTVQSLHFGGGESITENSGLVFNNTGTTQPTQFTGQSIYVGLTGPANTSSGTGNIFLSGQIIPRGTAPTCTVGAAAGTGATCTILASSTNTSGQVSIVNGTSTTTGTVVTINWSGTLASAPGNCPITARATATSANVTDTVVAAPTTTTQVIGTGAAAFTASQANVWGYGPCV